MEDKPETPGETPDVQAVGLGGQRPLGLRLTPVATPKVPASFQSSQPSTPSPQAPPKYGTEMTATPTEDTPPPVARKRSEAPPLPPPPPPPRLDPEVSVFCVVHFISI